jgi:hypothetical protein
MATDYTLSWILPFVRESLRGRGNFNFDHFIDGLWTVLEKTGVPGIVRHPPHRGYSGTAFDSTQAPHQLRAVAAESFYYLIQNGFVIPGPPTNNPGFPAPGMLYLTSSGLAWAASAEPLPEDYNGYLKLLRGLVRNVDSVTEQYVSEGLSSFVRGTYFAAAVMIGAAAEKEIYLLAESMVNALKDSKQQKKLTELLDGRSLRSLFRFVDDEITQASKNKTLPYSVAESAVPHLMSLIEAIRVQRNDAVHPMNAKVSEDSVRHAFQAFPHALEKLEKLRAWFLANPKSI